MRGSRAAAPKGTKSCRTQGDFRPSIHPFFRSSVCPRHYYVGTQPFGKRPRRGRSPVEKRGVFFVRPSVRPPPPQALSGLKSALSGLKSALSGLKSALSGLESALSGLKFVLSGLKPVLSGLESAFSALKSALSDSRPERADFRPEKADFRPKRADFRPERVWGVDGQKDK